jgi:hypothetical protein
MKVTGATNALAYYTLVFTAIVKKFYSIGPLSTEKSMASAIYQFTIVIFLIVFYTS